MTHLPFPFTKFLPPLLDEGVSAGALVARMAAAVAAHPLTIVAAPAGSGKTTAIAAWAEQSTDPVAWIRLEGSDDSGPAAAAALLAGAQRVLPGFGQRLEQVLQSREGNLAQVVTALVNDLGNENPLILVLDDFHVLTDTGSYAFFDRLLDHLPTNARLLIGSRSEPALSLPRRRVGAQVAEFGLADLRLDRAAIRRMLGPMAAVDDALVASIEAETGGWAAAVRLYAARAQLLERGAEVDAAGPGMDGMRRAGRASTGPRRAGFPAGRAGISPFRPDLWRYLTEEVWTTVPEPLQAFLLDTCILEELTVDVCRRLRGRSDSLDHLAELERRQLFVTRHAGAAAEAWRYHDLFRDFLRQRLRASREPEVVRELHRRAAAALPGVGGIEHFLAAGEDDLAAVRILEIGYDGSCMEVIPRLAPWVGRLPAEVRARHPRLDLLLAGFDELQGRLAEVRARLEPLRERLRRDGEPVIAAEAAAGLVSSYIVVGDFASARAAVAEALAQPLPDWLRAGTLLMQGWIEYHQANWSEADAALEQALELAVGAEAADVARLVALGVVSPMLLLSRDRRRMLERTRRLLSRLEAAETVSLAGPRCVLATAALLRLDVAVAEREARNCLRQTREFGGLPWIDQDAERLLLIVSLGRADHAMVRQLVEAAVGRMHHSEVDAAERWGYAYAAIRSDWLRGRGEEIAATAARVLHGEPRGPAEAIVGAIAAALTARLEGRAADAVAMLRDAEDFQRESPVWLCAGLPGLERASVLLERGRTAAAIDAAEPTLGAAAELGPGILLPEVASHRDLLQACVAAGRHADTIQAVFTAADAVAAPNPRALPGSAERVSARELEVLRLVAGGRSNRQIAETLFISEVTVKSHLTRIHRKLGARSRTHAVAIARELRLL